MINVQSIKSWFPILRWDKVPNFSSCHHATSWDEFQENYYCCEKLIQLEDNIVETLRSGSNISNVRLTGVPGAGKTSFVYHLMKKAKFDKQDIIFQKYVFYIFHANKANDEHYKKHARQEVMYGLEELFEQCGHHDIYKRIEDRDELNLKGQINMCVRYYKQNIKLFKKTLIFIIDDVDLLDNELAWKIAKTIIQDLEVRTIVKWVSIRGVTYNNYSGVIKRFFEEFFPTIYNIPESSLGDIIQYRIDKMTEATGKNPYSRDLCDNKVIHLFEGNKRSSLSLLKSILEDNLPKEIKLHSDERFIKNYINRVAIYTFITKGAISNIHLPRFRSIKMYPLPMDILSCLYYSPNINTISGAVNEIIIKRCNDSPSWEKERRLVLKTSDISFTLKKLKSENLIYSNEKEMFELTPTGKILCQYLNNQTYIQTCISNTPELDRNYQYEEFTRTNINYEKIVTEYITWECPLPM